MAVNSEDEYNIKAGEDVSQESDKKIKAGEDLSKKSDKQRTAEEGAPAAYSDGITCANCSRYKYFGILNLLLQLMMVTLLYLAVILFQIKGTCSPFNVIITNCQLGINAIMIGTGLYARIICTTNM